MSDELELVLRKVVAATRLKLDREMLRAMAESLEGEAYVDAVSGDVKFYFTAMVNGKGNRICAAQYPEDWWQAFKERWFPEWAKRRWPVQYREVRYEKFAAMCPHVHVADPKSHLRFLYDAPELPR